MIEPTLQYLMIEPTTSISNDSARMMYVKLSSSAGSHVVNGDSQNNQTSLPITNTMEGGGEPSPIVEGGGQKIKK